MPYRWRLVAKHRVCRLGLMRGAVYKRHICHLRHSRMFRRRPRSHCRRQLPPRKHSSPSCPLLLTSACRHNLITRKKISPISCHRLSMVQMLTIYAYLRSNNEICVDQDSMLIRDVGCYTDRYWFFLSQKSVVQSIGNNFCRDKFTFLLRALFRRVMRIMSSKRIR